MKNDIANKTDCIIKNLNFESKNESALNISTKPDGNSGVGFKTHPGYLLRPWIRRFTMIISALWLRTSSKFSGQEIRRNPQ